MRYKKLFLVLLALVVAAGTFVIVNKTIHNSFKLKVGDIVFQDLDCGVLCNSIENVTDGIDGARLSHVAVVSKIDADKAYVIEAYEGVAEVPLEKLFNRSHDSKGRPKVLIGRLLPKYSGIIPEAIKRAYKLIGSPYDKRYIVGDDAYYCSELIYTIFKENDKDLFDLNKMTFKEPKTGVVIPAWSDYFNEQGIPVPEGELGINPGSISRSPKLKIVHAYGCPDNWSGCVF